MCGYCIEQSSFSLLALPPGEPLTNRMAAIGYLQDCPDLHAALAQLTLAVDPIAADVIAYRGLEVLMHQGFASEAYQALLAAPQFIAGLDLYLGAGGPPAFPAAHVDNSVVAWASERKTFTEAVYLDEHLAHLTFAGAESILAEYIEFRLKGKGLRRNDLDQAFKETGIFDPIQDVCEEDLMAVVARFPALWLALHWLGRQAKYSPLLWQLVTLAPIGVPDFNSPELWLQRRAALIAYDRSGMAPFLKDLSAVRAELFQFLALMRSISAAEKAGLLTVLAGLSAGDHWGDHFSLRQWLDNGDRQVGDG